MPKYSCGSLDDLKNEEDLKNEDNLKNEENLKNEDDLKNEDILKNEDNTKMCMASTTLSEKIVDDSSAWQAQQNWPKIGNAISCLSRK